MLIIIQVFGLLEVCLSVIGRPKLINKLILKYHVLA